MCSDICNLTSIDWNIIIVESVVKKYLQGKCKTGLNGNLLEVSNSEIIYSNFNFHLDWC